MDSYPEVAIDACCEKWKGNSKTEAMTGIHVK